MRILKSILFSLLACASQYGLASSFKTEKWLTNNGVQVVFYQAMEVPMLDVSLAFAAGSAYDGPHYGLSSLTCNMINQGSLGQEAIAIANALTELGAQLDAHTSRDMVVFNLRTLTQENTLEKANAIFSKIINHPDFPDEAFEREKNQLLMHLKQTQESPADIANLNFFQTLYKDHPYAHSVNGTLETIQKLHKNQVVDFYKQYYVAHNAVLVLVGAIDPSKAHQLAEQLTQELPKGKLASLIPPAMQVAHAEQKIIPFPSSQTMLRLGQIGIDHHNPNYFPLLVGNYIFGGDPLDSRLGEEVREKRGLTYGVDSQFVPMPGEGPFLISLATKNNNASTALKITQNTLAHFIQEGPNQEELIAAKRYLIGSFPLSLDSNRTIADLLLRMAFYHLPDDFLNTYVDRIQAVSLEAVKQAFKQQVDLDKLVLIRVGQS